MEHRHEGRILGFAAVLTAMVNPVAQRALERAERGAYLDAVEREWADFVVMGAKGKRAAGYGKGE